MLSFVENTPAIVAIRFGDDKPIIPDAGSVTYEIRDAMGNALTGYENLPVETGPTTYQTSLRIPAAVMQIGANRLFDRRTIVVYFNDNGVSAMRSIAFRILKWIPHSVTEESVRQFCGVGNRELPSDAIDLFTAYMQVEKVLGAEALDLALTSGTQAEIAANTLIRMTAVLQILPSLQHRVLQREEDGVMAYQRMNIKNFDDIRQAALDHIREAYGEIQTVSPVAMTLVVTTQEADAITGG